MYYTRQPKEPSGCSQTIVITRVILSLLIGPLALIGGVMLWLLVTLFVLTESPLLALIPIGLGGLALFGFARWEKARVEKQLPHDEE